MEDSGEVLDITLEDSAASQAAGGEVVGKTCPYCRFPIKLGDTVQVCPDCALAHHRDCWQENAGCTTYGCRSSPQVSGAMRAAAPGAATASRGYARPGAVPQEALGLLGHELDRLATNALIFSLLGILILPALIGLLSAIAVLGQIRAARVSAPQAAAKAWAALGISIAALVLWLILFVVFASQFSP